MNDNETNSQGAQGVRASAQARRHDDNHGCGKESEMLPLCNLPLEALRCLEAGAEYNGEIMSEKDTGGPAFLRLVDPCNQAKSAHKGMTLLDYFAAHADMAPYSPRQALESKLDRKVTMAELAEYIAQIRHIEAKAMLAERAK